MIGQLVLIVLILVSVLGAPIVLEVVERYERGKWDLRIDGGRPRRVRR